MAFSIFPQNFWENYIPNFYRSVSFGKDKNLVTTEHGAWVLLNDEEFRNLRSLKVHEYPEQLEILKDKGIVVTEDNLEKIIKTHRKRYNFLFGGPNLHIIVPTFRCNMRCSYCHSAVKPVESADWDMDEYTAKSIVDFILTSPSNNLTIEFQGGDCLLNFDIVKFIIEYAEIKSREKNKKIGFTLVTNLTLMNDEILNFLKKHNIVSISTSLDGPKEIHDMNRKYLGGEGSYEDVAYWIKRINNEFDRYFSLGAMMTVTKYSLPYAKEIVDEYLRLGFTYIWPRVMNNMGFASSAWDKIGYTAEEYTKFYKEMLDYILILNKENKRIVEGYSYYFTQKILNEYSISNVDMWSPCGAGIGQLVYDHKGDIFTCDEAKVLGEEFKLGNVKKNNIKEVLNHPTLISMIKVSSKLPLICDKCAFSPYCSVCPVHFYLTQGNILPKMAGEFRCKIFKEVIKTVFEKIMFSENERKIFLNWINMPRIPREKLIENKISL